MELMKVFPMVKRIHNNKIKFSMKSYKLKIRGQELINNKIKLKI